MPIAAEAELELDERDGAHRAPARRADHPRDHADLRHPRARLRVDAGRREGRLRAPPPRGQDHQLAPRRLATTTCARTSSTSGSRSRPRPTPSSGLEGTLEVLQELTGAESIRQLPTLQPVQDQHEPGDGEGHRRAGRHGRGRAAARARGPALRRHRHRRDPGAPGADGGRRPPLRRGRRRGRDEHRGAPRPPGGDGASARSCAASPRSSSTAAPASRPTGWASGGCPTSRSLETGARMAAVRGISHCYERPTYADWPYSVFTMAHGRSKEECDAILDSIADEHDLHGDDRAVLYSSTEFKKIRLHYFTDDYARWEREHRRRRSPLDARRSSATNVSLDTRASEVIYARAVGLLPGGVNSPVRAMRSIGRDHPIFIERGEGCRADRRRRPPLRRLGLLVGAADPRPRPSAPSSRRCSAAAERGHQLRRADRGRGRAGGRGRRARAVGGDGADGQLGHRGRDERGAPGARGDRPRRGR